ncbi:hypothetical protein [Puniceibacterium sp. IMCC21224]|nr:hypothetical protein [Puniceibacterium sp. IMCC21224]KMK68592.1 hypothetical protein IMCC21224_113475 [Puniceibacterium sp. IMCC21224]
MSSNHLSTIEYAAPVREFKVATNYGADGRYDGETFTDPTDPTGVIWP